MSPASRLDALLCMCVRPRRHLYQHVNVGGGGLGGGVQDVHRSLSCTFDGINATQMKCLHTQSGRMFFALICT